MRRFILLALPMAAAASGCSYAIALSGTDIHDMKTRDAFHAKFGEPEVVGVSDGQTWEVFRTRQKLREERIRHPGNAMILGATLGLSEFVSTPLELYQAAKSSVYGQTILASYDEFGNVTYRDHRCNHRLSWASFPIIPQVVVSKPARVVSNNLERGLQARLPIAAASRG